jgi:hypothetical protein
MLIRKCAFLLKNILLDADFLKKITLRVEINGNFEHQRVVGGGRERRGGCGVVGMKIPTTRTVEATLIDDSINSKTRESASLSLEA